MWRQTDRGEAPHRTVPRGPDQFRGRVPVPGRSLAAVVHREVAVLPGLGQDLARGPGHALGKN